MLIDDGMSPQERLTAIAAIFADALIRLKSRRIQACPDSGKTSPEGLELRDETRLSVCHGGLQTETFQGDDVWL